MAPDELRTDEGQAMSDTDEYDDSWLYGRFGRELTEWERDELSDAAADMFHRGGMMCQGLARYNLYRRRGFDKVSSFTYALVWCANSIEQSRRRLSHETGAEGWQKMSVLDQEHWAGV